MNTQFYTDTAIDPWFTVEKLDESTYAISEYAHWEEPHSYLLLGTERAILIDTGLGVSDIRRVVETLTSLPVLVVTTHIHWDHIGGHGRFPHFAVHEAEQQWISDSFPLPQGAVIQNLTHGSCVFPKDFDPDQYQIFQGSPSHLLREGDVLELGGRSLQVIHTPGHSPGHCCFYEPGRKYLYSGDLIYRGCLDVFYPTTDPLEFYQSIQKICNLDITRILPGHHTLDVPADLPQRINAACCQLDASGQLHHGSGIFDFVDFQIHL